MAAVSSLLAATVLLCVCAVRSRADADVCPEDASTVVWPPVSVQTSKGLVEGVTMDIGTLGIKMKKPIKGTADVFRGIPYAESVSGERRFTVAEEKKAWEGTLDASKYAKMCPQKNQDSTTADEDCLTLNVFTTQAASSQSHPVLVWIHGGGFRSGSANDLCPWGIIYNLVQRGVVVVSIQYRLGFLGYFTTNTSEFPANLGMRDQVLALEWIQNEIGNFGGDPSQVTLFGTSAGAMSIGLHTVSPMSQGLFSQAYMGSGCALVPVLVDGMDYWHEPSKLWAITLCSITAEQWAEMSAGVIELLQTCLAQLGWDVLVDVAKGSLITPGWFVWQPTVDGDGGFLPDFPANLASTRDNSMPVIIGTVPDEMATKTMQQYMAVPEILDAVDEASYTDALENLVAKTDEYGDATTAVRDLIDAHFRPNGRQPRDTDNVAWLKLHQDESMSAAKLFHAPVVGDANLHLDNGNVNVRLFSFDYSSPALRPFYPKKYKAVLHSESKYYELSLASIRRITEHHKKDAIVIDKMGIMLTDFAKFGDPTPDAKGKAKWLPITSEKPSQYLSMSKNMRMRPELRKANVQLFNELVPAAAVDGAGLASGTYQPVKSGGEWESKALMGPGDWD